MAAGDMEPRDLSWTPSQQLIQLGSSNLVSSFTILGHRYCYMFRDLDLIFKVTEVEFDILVFGLPKQIKLGSTNLINM